ncbi:caspase, partial [filamentous cyanobacterium CCP5]
MHDFGQSLAVVVGINQYQHGIAPLATAMTDAKAIAHILKEYHDYQVFSLIDEEATLSKLKELFQASLPSLVQPGDRLFVYFAGHGIALNGDEGPKGYLIPKDAVVGDTNTYLSMDELYQALMDLPCHHMLTVLDCCFAGG